MRSRCSARSQADRGAEWGPAGGRGRAVAGEYRHGEEAGARDCKRPGQVQLFYFATEASDFEWSYLGLPAGALLRGRGERGGALQARQAAPVRLDLLVQPEVRAVLGIVLLLGGAKLRRGGRGSNDEKYR